MAQRPLTPHQRIMTAYAHGKGVRLTAEEVEVLALDDAIETRASNDAEDQLAAERRKGA